MLRLRDKNGMLFVVLEDTIPEEIQKQLDDGFYEIVVTRSAADIRNDLAGRPVKRKFTPSQPKTAKKPPIRGKGSSRGAWVAFAQFRGHQIPTMMTRDEIIALVNGD